MKFFIQVKNKITRQVKKLLLKGEAVAEAWPEVEGGEDGLEPVGELLARVELGPGVAPDGEDVRVERSEVEGDLADGGDDLVDVGLGQRLEKYI